MIDWRKVQTRLKLTADGLPGRNTYTALFRHMAGNASADVLESLGNAAAIHVPVYGAHTSADRLADLLAQTANETGGYSTFVENLNYSAKRLTQVWPSRFPSLAAAQQVAGKPELIANKVYGGRMGNMQPGDGWSFRGRGMLQLTGRANYEAADRRLGLGLDTNPEIAAVPAMSLLLALDFYATNKVWKAIDDGDLIGARRITNIGNRYANATPIGWSEVQKLRAKAMEVLS